MDDLTTRVWRTTMGRRWPSYLVGAIWWVGSLALTIVTYGVKLERDDSGVLRVVGVDIDLPLYTAALWAVGYGFFLAVCVTVGASISQKLAERWNARDLKKGVADAARKTAARYSSNSAVVERSRAMIEEGTADDIALTLARAVVEAADAEVRADEPASVASPHY